MQRWKAEYLVKGSLVLLYNRKNRGGMFSLCQSYIKKKVTCLTVHNIHLQSFLLTK